MTLYTATVADTGFDPVVIPVKSFALRIRQSPKKIYLSVTIPAGLRYIDDCIERADGTITLDCLSPAVEIVAANIDTIRLIESAAIRTINIVAYKQTTFPGGTEHTISNPVELIDDAVIALPDPTIKPADTVILPDGERFTVIDVNWVSGGYMELTGREPRGSQIRLSSGAEIGLPSSAILRPSHHNMSAQGQITPSYSASWPAYFTANGLIDLAPTPPHLVLDPVMQAQGSIDLSISPPDLSVAADNMPDYIVSLNPIGYWRLVEDLTTFPNLGTLGSTYDAVTTIKDGQSGRETYIDTQHAACVPALTDKGLWTKFYWHLQVDSGFTDLTGDLTIICWATPEDSTYEKVLGRDPSSASIFGRALLMSVDPTNGAEMWWKNASGTSYNLNGDDALSGQNMVAVRMGLGDADLIVDDVLDDTRGTVTIASQSGKTLYLLGQKSDEFGFWGTVQDFAIWDRRLTDTELETIYNLGVGP